MVQEKLITGGQSLWMDDHSRAFMRPGTLFKYIEEYCVTGLSVNSKAMAHTLASSNVYDQDIARKLSEGFYGESLACSLVHDDTRLAADMLRHVHDRTDGADGWAMLPASPLAVDNPETLIEFIHKLSRKVGRPNILVRLPMLTERISTLEELVYQGLPLNITNIYSHSQYLEVAQACLDGLRRRINEQLKPVVPIFIYIGIFRLQATLKSKLSDQEAAEGAVAMAKKIYKCARTLHNSPEWERVYNSGARPLRLVWNCSNGAAEKQEKLSLAHRLKTPFTIMTLPGELIVPFVESRHKDLDMQGDMDCDGIFQNYRQQGVDLETVAVQLQKSTVELQRNQWIMMLEAIAKKSAGISQMKTESKKGE